MLRLTLIAAASLFAIAAQAQTLATLVGDDMLVHVDAKSWTATKTVKITGLPARVAGIDMRPADGMLYALAEDGTVATIDPASGKATIKSKLETMLAKGVTASVDFNPVADRLRILGSDGTSLRANVDDGKVAVDGKLRFKEGDANAAKAATIVAGAYSNSMKGAKETALYDIDAAGVYARQAPPNDGILNTLGTTGVSAATIAFDIASDGNGGNAGWLVAGADVYAVDLVTGKATKRGAIKGLKGAARDIAILPN
ncbi:MAG: DUF4394 domain-containing protein [Methylobacteriaceae bacterium]|nr:DUF4394 domain-containing protein [Methylobacteriaceae bacterium]